VSRSLDDLFGTVRDMATEFRVRCDAIGVDVLIYCTYRSLEEQSLLYRQGRSVQGKIVTYAKAGESAHNFGMAFDCVPMLHGKPQWSPKSPQWGTIGAVGQSVGLEWAGRWTRFREFPHFQMPEWRRFVQ
jgi:peptidoglycan L-alanyl-D-glutamate endopeptidase CwlK